MATRTQVCNLALARIGNQRITDHAESSPAAEHLRTQWDSVRRTVLRLDNWSFAITPVELSEISSAEATTACDIYDYEHAWQLPPDLISIHKFNAIETGTKRTFWKVANGVLYSNDSEAKLEYVKDVTDCTQWPDDFATAVSAFLAAAVAPAITSDPKLGMQLLGAAQSLIKTAESADTDQEGVLNVISGIEHSPYALARRGYYGASDQQWLDASAWRDFNPASDA